MAIGKGYPTQEKEDRLKAEFVTVEPVRTLQHGMSVLAHQFVSEVGTDAVEASSTTSIINATAHAAQKGDVILFTSGALSGKEAKVSSTATNTITLAETLPSAPATAVTFSILRHKYPTVNSSGAVLTAGSSAAPLQFVLDGVDTEVEEDTVTPANNRPLPVKLTSVTGDINITAGDLNVQSSHTGANPDSIRIGDGTEEVAINASNEMQVRDNDANTSLTSLAGTVSGTELQVDIVSSALPTGAATEATLATIAGTVSGTELQVDVLSSALPTGAATEATLATIAGTVAGSEVQVDVVSSALPTGAATEATLLQIETAVELIDNAVNTDGAAIGTQALAIAGTDGANAQIISVDSSGDVQVDVLSSALPTGAATETTLQAVETAVELIDNAVVADGASAPSHGLMIAGYDGANAQYIATDASGNLQVDILTAPAPASLDVVDFIDTTPVLDTSLTNIPASAGSPVEIVASLAANVSKLKINDTTGFFIGVYTGAALSEVLQCIVGPGEDGTIEVAMTSGERVSLRAMANAAIASGEICIQFLG